MPIARNTGFPGSDAQDDFLRARRGRMLARLSSMLRLQAGDVDLMLSFDEVVDALGRVAVARRRAATRSTRASSRSRRALRRTRAHARVDG